jgi:hypothetical protein
VRHVPDQLVARRVEHRVQRHGQFHHAQPRAEMPAGFRHGRDGLGRSSCASRLQLGIAQPLEIGRGACTRSSSGVCGRSDIRLAPPRKGVGRQDVARDNEAGGLPQVFRIRPVRDSASQASSTRLGARRFAPRPAPAATRRWPCPPRHPCCTALAGGGRIPLDVEDVVGDLEGKAKRRGIGAAARDRPAPAGAGLAAQPISAPVLPACSAVISSSVSGGRRFRRRCRAPGPAPCPARPAAAQGSAPDRPAPPVGVAGSGRDQLEGQRLQRIARQNRGRLVPFDVHGGLAPAQVVVIHAGQIVMHEAVGMQRLDRRGGPDRALGATPCSARPPSPETRAAACRPRPRSASPAPPRPSSSVPGLRSNASSTRAQRVAASSREGSEPVDRLGPRRVAIAVERDRGDLFLGLFQLPRSAP